MVNNVTICTALTGAIGRKEHNRYIPISIDEIISDGIACVNAGSSILHIHARDVDGEPTHDKYVYADIMAGIREVHPDVVICVSTSGRKDNTFEGRSQMLSLRPEMASLTLGSFNFPEGLNCNTTETIYKLVECMLEYGIIPEFEVFDCNMINMMEQLIEKYDISKYYVNFVLGTKFSTLPTVRNLGFMVDSIPNNVNWACGSVGKSQLDMNTASILMGGNIRTGLEDNIYYTYKKLAKNVDLVERCVNICEVLGRDVSTISDTRLKMGI